MNTLTVILIWYGFMSLAAFAVYGFDKRAAQKNRWRVPEAHLHLFALLGGWPGALCAQRLLRHKSVKTSFRIIFWITVLLNAATLGWLLMSGHSGV